jgi:hypothetical protein
MTSEDYLRLGVALSKAQNIEFAIYGILTHLKKTPEIVKDKRLRNLTPREFLSSDPINKPLRTMTLGQLNKALPEGFGLCSEYIQDYVDRRNLLVHEFMREINPKYASNGVIDPEVFLTKFIVDSDEFESILLGLLYVIMDQVADKQGVPERKPVGEDVDLAKAVFYEHILKQKTANKIE